MSIVTAAHGWMTDVDEQDMQRVVDTIMSRTKRLERQVRDLTTWRPMDTAPKEKMKSKNPWGKFEDPIKFLALRNGEVVLCWWNDGVSRTRIPMPFWEDHRKLGVVYYRNNPPDGWLPLPAVDMREIVT